MAIVMISDVPWFPKLGYPKADFASYVLIESVAKMVRDRCLSPVFAENGSGRIMTIRPGMMLLVRIVFQTYAGNFRVRSVGLFLDADAVCLWNLRESRCHWCLFVGYEFDF